MAKSDKIVRLALETHGDDGQPNPGNVTYFTYDTTSSNCYKITPGYGQQLIREGAMIELAVGDPDDPHSHYENAEPLTLGKV
jgi:hypothetical protein